MAKELKGVLAALCTPFDESGEHLAEGKLCAHIDRMIEAGVHGIVLCAGTGEFAFLREDEKRWIIELGTRHIDGRVAVIAQTSAINTADAIERAKHAEGAGADALMILPPYFEGPGEAGTIRHYERIAAAVSTPMVLYNIPQVAGFEITPALFERFLELDNVEYVKDSKGDLVSQQELVATGGKVLSGADPIAPFAIMAGSVGWIWGAVNVMPHESVQLYNLLVADRHAEALALWRRMAPLNIYFWYGVYNMLVKEAANLRGFDLGPVRASGMPATDGELEALRARLAPLESEPAAA